MNNFKIGDKVRCIDPPSIELKRGVVYTVFGLDTNKNIRVKGSNGNISCFWKQDRFELVPSFDMNTQPWFIRFNNEQEYDIAQQFLLENYDEMFTLRYEHIKGKSNCLTNSYIDGNIPGIVLHGKVDVTKKRANEIKLKYKLVLDSVEYPTVVSEQQKEIQKIEEEMRYLAERLNVLKESL